MDTLIRASVALLDEFPDLQLAISGSGRDTRRLAKLIDTTRAPAVLLGRVPGDDLPALYASADLFAMLCRVRWGGLEQEGFGIVFVEAAATGVAQVAGASGGAAEAVEHGHTGLVVDPGDDVDAAAEALGSLLRDPDLRAQMGANGRLRATQIFGYDGLAAKLATALDALGRDILDA